MSRLIPPALLALCLAAPAAAAPGLKTFVVIRHAEAEPESAGPQRHLTADGERRARELARVLGEQPLTAVYATQYARTKLTAEPVARASGARVVEVDDTPKTIAALESAPWGSTTVVVGHSNTVPQIVAGLTHQPYPTDQPVTHDRMWLVTVARDGSISAVRMRYGAPDALPPPGPPVAAPAAR